jgi:hypothetical protein
VTLRELLVSHVKVPDPNHLLKHPSTMPNFFAARRLLQHPQPRHPRD